MELSEKNIKRMWEIDAKSHTNTWDLTQEEKDFYNTHFDLMLEKVEEDYNHWKHHTGGKLN